MKLRNKETGEIWTLINRNEGTSAVLWVTNGSQMQVIESIEELTSRFEDYQEPKTFWFVNDMGGVDKFPPNLLDREAMVESHEKIGNCFETKEEAEKAVEKLKAWKRLKDNGVEFKGWVRDKNYWGDYIIRVKMTDETTCDDEDLDLIFGGRE